MYYYFKDNVFYLKQGEGVFFKNNFCAVNIKNNGSYKLFKTLLPLLNGTTDVEEKIAALKKENVKKFFYSLIEVFVKNKFVLYSDTPICFDNISDHDISLLYCYGDKMELPQKKKNIRYSLSSENEKVNKIICNAFEKHELDIEYETNSDKYITISAEKKLYIYKNKEKLIITSKYPENSLADLDIFDYPLHMFEIIAAFAAIECDLMEYGYSEIDFDKQAYIFDTVLLQGNLAAIGN